MLAEERNLNTPKVSVIMPTYNAQNTIIHAIKSVLNTPRYREIEIIVVDDCSKDDTIITVRKLQGENNNIKLYTMPQNSGGPSAPRNLGIEKSMGEYITFLDDDDWFDINRLMEMVDVALDGRYDFLKGYLVIVGEGKEVIANRLVNIPVDQIEIIKAMISFQSTTQDFIVKRELLINKNIRYPINLKIGEDTVFVTKILAAADQIKYIDNFFLYYNKGLRNTTTLSSTQQCGNLEIMSQLQAWRSAQDYLSHISIDYFQLRLYASFRNLLSSIVRYSQGIDKKTYECLHQFACETKKEVSGKMNLHTRYRELYNSILSGDYEAYLQQSKIRLLITGYDLKFIKPIIPYLEENYEVKVDEWTGHNSHDKRKSKSMAEWADIIWCEWLLGNAVFYSKAKNNNQRLIIRAHRFELFRDFGDCIDYNKVDMVVTVGYYYFEQFAKRFSIPKAKMRLLPNYVENSIYSDDKKPDVYFHIGLVGILPKRKGFHKGLSILKMLKERDDRFKLYVMGQQPNQVSWILNNPTEASYYKECDAYIEDNKLTTSVIYGGFVPREQLYENIGYVLSLSDDEEPESFHLAPAEGACSGSMGLLLKWPGVEYIYPQTVLFSSLEEIVETIYECSQNPELFKKKSSELKEFATKNYSIWCFMENLRRYLKQLYLLG